MEHKVLLTRSQRSVASRSRSGRALVLAVVLLAALAVLSSCALQLGAAGVSTSEAIAVVLRRLRLIEGADVSVLADRIVWDLRMPRLLAAICVGTVLATCGVILQSLTGNELADPYLLGISSGASVGAVAVIVFGLSVAGISSDAFITFAAFTGALAALAAVLGLARVSSGALPTGRTILAGVAIAQLCGAVVSAMIMVFGEREASRQVMVWTLGSLAGTRWPTLIPLGLALALCVVVVLLACPALDAFSFGENAATSLGIDANRTRWLLLIVTALLTATTVAFVGPIGFVGLTVPHLVRLVVGPQHRLLLPLAALSGGFLLLLADTAARVVRPSSEVPIGVMTALIGAPVLVFLLKRQGSAR